MKVPVYKLHDDQRLVEWRHQIHGRGHGYVVSDRYGSSVLVCEKLPWAAVYINTLGVDKVSVASLYEAAKFGRLVHRRWSCRRLPLDEAAAAFEEERRAHPGKAVVLGWRHHVTVE